MNLTPHALHLFLLSFVRQPGTPRSNSYRTNVSGLFGSQMTKVLQHWKAKSFVTFVWRSKTRSVF